MKVEPVIVAGPWRLYPDSMQVGFRLKLDRVQLNKMEFRILREFATNQQRVLSREELLKAVGDNKRRRDRRTVDACLSQLRRKLEEDPENPTFLFGDSRNGYVFSLDASWRSRQRRLGQNNGRRSTRQRKPAQRTKPKSSRASRRTETTVFQNRILDPIPLKPKTDLERLIESALLDFGYPTADGPRCLPRRLIRLLRSHLVPIVEKFPVAQTTRKEEVQAQTVTKGEPQAISDSSLAK